MLTPKNHSLLTPAGGLPDSNQIDLVVYDPIRCFSFLFLAAPYCGLNWKLWFLLLFVAARLSRRAPALAKSMSPTKEGNRTALALSSSTCFSSPFFPSLVGDGLMALNSHKSKPTNGLLRIPACPAGGRPFGSGFGSPCDPQYRPLLLSPFWSAVLPSALMASRIFSNEALAK